MNIQILGLNHKTAPIEIREKLVFSQESLAEALFLLKKYSSVEENLILSTCNRVEIYAVVKDALSGAEDIQDFICNFHRVRREDIRNHFYLFKDIEAIRHLFKVVSSLDSMILGETQIFGQVKDAYSKARQCNTAGRNLSSLFEEAIRAGKRVRTETQIGKGAVSISTAAIELAKKIFEDLAGKKVLIIGAGKIGELVVKNLYSRGIETVLVANRTFARAKELAEIFKGKAIGFEEIGRALEDKDADILISSTSAPHFILDKNDLRLIMQKRNHAPLFIIDLGLPRNIDPQINAIGNTYLYNIDDLAQVRDANLRERLKEAKKAEQILEYHIAQITKEIFMPQNKIKNEQDNCRSQGKPLISVPGRRGN